MDALGLLLGMGLVVCIGGVGVVALLVVLGRAWLRQQRITPKRLEPPTPAFLRAAQARLRPWQPAAWHDLAARWEGEWTSALPTVTVGQFRGLVPSLSQPQGPAWLAFDFLRPNRRDLHLVLCSTEHCLTLQGRFRSLLRGTADLGVQVDGRPWGTVHLPAGVFHRGQVVLRDAQGRVMGAFWHQVRSLVRSGWVGRMTIYYGPVHFRGRALGEVACTWVKVRNARQRARSSGYGRPLGPYPALRAVPEDLSEDEALWLLTAVAVEILLNIVVHDDKRIQDGWTPLPGLQVTFARVAPGPRG